MTESYSQVKVWRQKAPSATNLAFNSLRTQFNDWRKLRIINTTTSSHEEAKAELHGIF